MSNVKELSRVEIRDRFELLFEQIVADKVDCREWQQADVVFRGGCFSRSFEDVELLMASHHSGASILYSSQQQGSGLYSVVSRKSRVSFSLRS